MVKGKRTDNGVFNPSEFIEDLLKKQINIRFSRTDASHKNWSSEWSTKAVIAITRNMLRHDALRCPEYIFPLIFGQWEWNMMYRSTIISPALSINII